MTRKASMVNGQPASYWAFRNAVSFTQLCITVLAMIGICWWLAVDGNGKRLWESYYDFSQKSNEWAKNTLPYPGENTAGSSRSESAVDRETQLDWLVGEYCESGAESVFEGETDRFEIVICENSDGSLTYAGFNDELGGIAVPAEAASDGWQAENDAFTYIVDPTSLTVLDRHDTGTPVIQEDMRWSRSW